MSYLLCRECDQVFKSQKEMQQPDREQISYVADNSTASDTDVKKIFCTFFDDLSNGTWNLSTRTYSPRNCTLRPITSEQAQKCLGNRGLLFMGDSQMRDLGTGFAFFLNGTDVMQAADKKMDVKVSILKLYTWFSLFQVTHNTWKVHPIFNVHFYSKPQKVC